MKSQCSLWLIIVVVVTLTLGWVVSAPIGHGDSLDTTVFTSTTETPLIASSTIRPRLRSQSHRSTPMLPTTGLSLISSSTVRPRLRSDGRQLTPMPLTNELSMNFISTVRPRLWFGSQRPTPMSVTQLQERANSTNSSDNHDSTINGPGRHSADYILSDAEYQAILDQLRLEAESDVINNRDNYAHDDESADDIMRRIEFMEHLRQHQQEQGVIEGSIREENSEQLIEDQPTQRFSGDFESSPDDNKEECPICLTPIEELSDTPVIPCGHKFHRECLNKWKNQPMSASSKCPICRTPLW